MATIPAAVLDRAGIAGSIVLLPACAVLQIGLIGGQGYLFASLAIFAVTLGLSSLSNMLNLPATILQVNCNVISLPAVLRILFLNRAIRFNKEEKALLPEMFSILSRIAARQRIDAVQWRDAEAGTGP
jgi:membrane protein implicated in regulation of membrane protease activity